ncbi:conserved hypothetical protein [Vibrio crassostreae]|jgi:hypothetical protein|uniref:Uncharacterized protein n=2 Tax=Vibrio splendidus TaxID=29497 RepID=A0ABD5AFM6_VIBSP|nr:MULTISPECIES: hypothetical protein [Vibrio]OMO23715.1 hypothetical protein BH582_23580 [Vibrio sp. 10N.222.47.A9]CAH7306640.1 conserved hypothetical protein [Vibrio chagasii]MDH5967467.1 hypothetical protein [Vibrio aestuarianus]MDP2491116.1 hypothetical protein [Vibrio splendidus]PMG49628.1 hypothetical protein BCU89_25265 [Vibrio splendidus]
MEQTNEVLLNESAAVDDWGDFGAVIDQLEQQEQTESEPVSLTGSTETVTEDKTEAMAGLLDIVFALTEQATSMISGVEFEFDGKGKQAVIDAAQPVFAKHGSTLMGVFGDYIEEATLLLAVLGLIYASKQQMAALMQAKETESEQTQTPSPTESR